MLLDDTTTGLIAGYGFEPERRGRRLNWAECLQQRPDADADFRWLHINLAMQPARRWLTDASGLPEAVVEAMLDADPHYHVVTTAQGFLLTLHDVVLGRSEDQRADTGLIAIWCDRGQMITIRRWPMQCTDQLIRTVESDAYAPASSIELFLTLFDHIVDNFRKRVVALRSEIDKAEDAFLAGRAKGLRAHLANLRRQAVTMHRRIMPEIHAINRLAGRLPAWVGENDQAYFRQIADEMSTLDSDIMAAQERTRVLQDEHASKLAEDTNRNLYVLSVVSVTLMPMTFVTGFFGMNTANLPFTTPESLGSTASIAIILAVGAVTVLFLRKVLLRTRRD
ncbi:MAG: CorA family divalent cation transporter [Rhodospirillaceae bacterium]